MRALYRHVVVLVDDGELKRCLSPGSGSCKQGLVFRTRAKPGLGIVGFMDFTWLQTLLKQEPLPPHDDRRRVQLHKSPVWTF